jgi:hypothetical protein
MVYFGSETDDVETKGKQIWGATRWAAVLNLLGAVEGLYGDEEYADLTIIRGKFPFRRRLALVSGGGKHWHHWN